MQTARLIEQLERFGRTLPVLVQGLSIHDARWKPDDGAWSILEIVCHLADEEIEDFRTRLSLTLEASERDWPPIDPEGVAVSRKYNEQNLDQVTRRFVHEREESLRWLRSLGDIDGTTKHRHPKFGPISAGQLLASWAAHDALHLRQIAKRLHQLASVHGAPFPTDYAGEWRT